MLINYSEVEASISETRLITVLRIEVSHLLSHVSGLSGLPRRVSLLARPRVSLLVRPRVSLLARPKVSLLARHRVSILARPTLWLLAIIECQIVTPIP